MKKPTCPKCGFDFARSRRPGNLKRVVVPLGPRKAALTLHDADCPKCMYRLHVFDLDANEWKLPLDLYKELKARQRQDDQDFRIFLEARERKETPKQRRARLRLGYNPAWVKSQLTSTRAPLDSETEVKLVEHEYRQKAREARRRDRQVTAEKGGGRSAVVLGKAIALLALNSDWTVKRIAAEAGCHPDYLSRSPRFKLLRELLLFLAENPGKEESFLARIKGERKSTSRKMRYRDPANLASC